MEAERARGRSSFARWRWVLRVGVLLSWLMPRALATFVWACVTWVPGVVGVAFRYVLACRLAKSVGDVVYFGTQVEVLAWEALSLGSNVSIHRGCYLDATGGITIENDVSIAHGCSLMSTNHQWHDESVPIRDNALSAAPLRIGPDVWVGCGARILAGTVISPRSIVAAGAVVTKDVPERTIVGGVPARPIRGL